MRGKNKVRSAKRRRIIIIIIIIIIIMGALASAFYLRQLDESVHEITVASIEELAVHDMKSISAKIDDLWGELDAVYYRTTNVGCASIQGLCDRLNLERASNIFDTIYLLDEDGYTYSSTNVVKDQSNTDYVQRLLSGKEQVIRRHDSGENFEYGRDRIVYGVRCEPFTCDGITFIGILGEAKNDTFRSILKISSFDGQGYTSIIDMDGNYLLNQSWKTGISDRENYFEELSTEAGLSDEDIEHIKIRINEKETFSERHLCQTHGMEIVSYFPMEKSGMGHPHYRAGECARRAGGPVYSSVVGHADYHAPAGVRCRGRCAVGDVLHHDCPGGGQGEGRVCVQHEP